MLISNPQLLWPDTMAVGPDGYLYVTSSQHREQGFEPGLTESESFIRIRLQSSSTTHRFGPIAERHGPADPRFEAAILSRTRSPSSQRARAKS
jgi:hypothetical protein